MLSGGAEAEVPRRVTGILEGGQGLKWPGKRLAPAGDRGEVRSIPAQG